MVLKQIPGGSLPSLGTSQLSLTVTEQSLSAGQQQQLQCAVSNGTD